MGRLLGHRAYLCGPMDRCPNGGVDWRRKLIPYLRSLGVHVIDPTNKPINVGVEDVENRGRREKIKELGDYATLSKEMKEIRSVDLALVDRSDFIVVNLDLEILMCGTLEEIFWANREKKPIIIRCPQGKKNIPEWLYGTCPHEMFFNEWRDVEQYLYYINCTTEHVETFNRWKFFKWT